MKIRNRNIGWVIALFFLAGAFYLYENYLTKSGEWKINWGLQVPEPSELTTVYEIGGFQDYEGYHVGEYSDWKLENAKKFKSWNTLNDNNFYVILKHVESFKNRRIEMSVTEPKEKERYQQLFKDNPVKFDKDSLWYWKAKGKDHYFLAILNPKLKKLYVMERSL